MHLKAILLLLVFFLILPPLETAAQVQDSVAVDSAMQALIHQQYELEKQKLLREKNKQIFQLRDSERRVKSKRKIVLVLIVAGIILFVAGIVLLVLWIIRKS